MPDSEDIVTNPSGGKQSKLYLAYHLIDPWAMEALASIHHRGAIKYTPDNWRKIPTEEHINHALHHLMDTMKVLTNDRRGLISINQKEDHLAHALCRITFAIAMEIDKYGLHPEHSDPAYHEPKTTSAELSSLRRDVPGVGPVPSTPGFDEGARSFAALVNKTERDNSKRASQASSCAKLGIGEPPVRSHRRR